MNQDFESAIRLYILHDEIDDLVRYINETEVNARTLEELKQAIKIFRLKILYYSILDKFSHILSNEEKKKYHSEFLYYFGETLD